MLEAEGGGPHVVEVVLTPSDSPQRLLVMAASRHSTGILLLQLELTPEGDAIFDSVHAPQVPEPSLTAEPPAIELTERRVSATEAHRILERAALAISAELRLTTSQSEGDIALRPFNTVHDTEAIGVRLWSREAAMIERRFDGQPGNITEPRRAPVDLIRADLETLLAAAAAAASPATHRHRTMLVDTWPSIGAVPAWTYARLLALAAALPSAELTPLLRSSLDPPGELSIPTINALVATTGADLRRNDAGQLRAAGDIAQAYRALLAKAR